jgi:hypothetical protein
MPSSGKNVANDTMHKKTKCKKLKNVFYTKEDQERIRTSFSFKDDETKLQIQHCISQLKRFSPCIENERIRSFQFFYNLGRLQELLEETTFPSIWWKPIEILAEAGKYKRIPKHIDNLRQLIGVSYDDSLIAKGC